jgi:peroxiredoxin
VQLAQARDLGGVDLFAVVVDPRGRNRAMVEKLGLDFPILSDPDGEGLIRPFGVWNDDRDIAHASTFIVRPDGTVGWVDAGAHPADRPVAEDVAAALDGLDLARTER